MYMESSETAPKHTTRACSHQRSRNSDFFGGWGGDFNCKGHTVGKVTGLGGKQASSEHTAQASNVSHTLHLVLTENLGNSTHWQRRHCLPLFFFSFRHLAPGEEPSPFSTSAETFRKQRAENMTIGTFHCVCISHMRRARFITRTSCVFRTRTPLGLLISL